MPLVLPVVRFVGLPSFPKTFHNQHSLKRLEAPFSNTKQKTCLLGYEGLEEQARRNFFTSDQERTGDWRCQIASVSYVQILGDPEAADLVFGCGAPIKVIGLDVTRNILMTGM